MSTSAKSVLVFGIYLVGIGAGLLLLPSLVLSVFGLPPANDIWPRVVGVLTLVLAFYYIQAARADMRAFFRWTVYARLGVFVSFAAFVLLGLTGPVTVLLGSVDLAGAIWTALTLRTRGD